MAIDFRIGRRPRGVPGTLAALLALGGGGGPSGFGVVPALGSSDLRAQVDKLQEEVQREGQRTQALQDDAAASKRKLLKVNDSLAAEQKKLQEAKEEAESGHRRPYRCKAGLLCWGTRLPHQGGVAAAAGLLGAAALLGPPSFRVAFSAVCGSALGALFVIGCALTVCSQVWATFASVPPEEQHTLPAALGSLLLGDAPHLCYWAWLALFFYSMLHWIGIHRMHAGKLQGASGQLLTNETSEGPGTPGTAADSPGTATATEDNTTDGRDDSKGTTIRTDSKATGPPGAGVGPLLSELSVPIRERMAGSVRDNTAAGWPPEPQDTEAVKAEGSDFSPQSPQADRVSKTGSFGSSVSKMLKCNSGGMCRRAGEE